MTRKILIIDDELDIRYTLREILQDENYQVDEAGDGDSGLRKVESFNPDCVLLDILLPPMVGVKRSFEGIEVLKRIKERHSNVAVILITGVHVGETQLIVQAIRELGAFSYIDKPYNPKYLLDQIESALQTVAWLPQAPEDWAKAIETVGLIYASDAMEQVLDEARNAASHNVNVLLLGESGTGKELIARAIHYGSPRRANRFEPVNCGAIPKELFESEIFGHEKGAFTGATTAKPGLVEVANGGTLFLDEIGELPSDIQVKFNRFLQEREFRRVGGTETKTSDVRIIAATNKDLQSAIERGEFREDLYYRINVFPINIPPLHERPEEIRLLAERFLEKKNKEHGIKVSGISDTAYALLTAYEWTGNVRELENVIAKAVIIDKDGVITEADLPSTFWEKGKPPETRDTHLSLPDYLKMCKQARIKEALMKTKGKVTKAAEELGITRDALDKELTKNKELRQLAQELRRSSDEEEEG